MIRNVVGFPGYRVSDRGVVYGKYDYALSQSNNNGYRQVGIHYGGKQLTKLVHRLVAKAFIPNPRGVKYINHKDGDKANNCVENLEWCTMKENLQHAIDTGLCFTKEVSQYDLGGRFICSYDTIRDAHRAVGGDYVTICDRVAGKGKTASGFIWREKTDEQDIEVGSLDDKCRECVQYSLNGELLAIFPSIRVASDEIGGSEKVIQGVCAKGKGCCYGYMWRYGGEDIAERIAPYRRRYKSRQVASYKNGKLVKRYNSLKEATHEYNICNGSIINCIKGKSKSCKGLQWNYI